MTSFQYEEINSLISGCLSGNASNDDITRLEQWVSASYENRKYYLQIKNIWDANSKALLPQDIPYEQAFVDVQRKIRNHRRWSILSVTFRKAAAILLLPLLALTLWLGKSSRSENEFSRNPVLCEVSAAFGTRSVITLSDGSRIWLNSGSSLKYPEHFTRNTREVYLNGEGYFEVDADKKTPFIVHTGIINVKATGTKFNINASGLDKNTSITLVSGKVTVCKNIDPNRSVELAEMLPDQHFTFDTTSGTFNHTREDTYKHIAWKDGKLVFRNEPLEDVLRKIGYYYNVDMVILDGKLREYRYRATFEEESIEEIMNLLKLSSPLDYRVEERKPLPDGSFPKKKIIIFPVKK